MKKKIIVVFGIFLILGFIIVGCINPINNYLTIKKYKDIGYNKTQIELMNRKISKEDKETLLNEEYLDYLEELLLSSSYNEEKFLEYVNYIKENHLKKENLESVLFLVNQGITEEYSSDLVEIIKNPYFIRKRLSRYLEYRKLHNLEDISTIIRNVNCNLDLDGYKEKADVSKESLLLVNSFYYLEKDYKTELVLMEEGYSNYRDSLLNKEAYLHFKELVDDAEKLGYHIRNNSSYRSYEHQEQLYNQYLRDYGESYTKKYVSIPGYSEHQTGYSLDVGVEKKYAVGKFENTKEFLWMKDNSYKYGFILRYTKEGQELFGYGYEPWHYRYVGVDAATYIYEHEITLEEYYAYFVENK